MCVCVLYMLIKSNQMESKKKQMLTRSQRLASTGCQSWERESPCCSSPAVCSTAAAANCLKKQQQPKMQTRSQTRANMIQTRSQTSKK